MAPIYPDREALRQAWRDTRPGGRIVFTNGCFDLLHAGHVLYLAEARALGDFLVLGLNGDASVRRLKGSSRPVTAFADRAQVLAALRSVDVVVGFDEDTPYELIQSVGPDLLVKGGDYDVDTIVGADIVRARGGEVRALQFKPGVSTSDIVSRIKEGVGVC